MCQGLGKRDNLDPVMHGIHIVPRIHDPDPFRLQVGVAFSEATKAAVAAEQHGFRFVRCCMSSSSGSRQRLG